jgi:hypothetical protein
VTLSLILRIGGGAMMLIGVIWGRAGFYPNQVPALLILVVGGAAAFFVGQTVKDRSQP